MERGEGDEVTDVAAAVTIAETKDDCDEVTGVDVGGIRGGEDDTGNEVDDGIEVVFVEVVPLVIVVLVWSMDDVFTAGVASVEFTVVGCVCGDLEDISLGADGGGGLQTGMEGFLKTPPLFLLLLAGFSSVFLSSAVADKMS